jgi:predicted esterase
MAIFEKLDIGFMETRKLKITKHARYFVSGKPSNDITQVWLICHGYGQLGNYFLRHFEFLQDGKALFIGCEGLHRFYSNGFSGRVGASWMTKEDRLDDIADYITYLDGVYSLVMESLPSSVKVTVLGFSQGAATVCRWISAGNQKVDQLILWAGVIPPDVDLTFSQKRFQTFLTRMVVGDEDEFIKEEDVEALSQKLGASGIPVELLTFQGKHELSPEILLELFIS